jgi:hypothetical protein
MVEERTWWESVKVEGGELLEQVKRLIHEGNVRRVVIKQGTRSVAEFPLTVGVVGAVAAPVLAAVGALAALITDCSIEIERSETTVTTPAPPVVATDVEATGTTGRTEEPTPPPVL